MKIKQWLKFEKQDLSQRIRTYPGYRLFLLFSAAFGFFVSFLDVWGEVYSPRMKDYDQMVIDWIIGFKTPLIGLFFNFVTQMASPFFIILIFILLALIMVNKRRKRAAVVALVSLLGSYLLSIFFKKYFGRYRPFGCLNNGDCYSYPSGHATIATYFYGLLNYLIFRFLPISLRSFLMISFFLAVLIFLISVSRLFLEVHYLSDLIGGFFLGGAWLMLAVFLIDVLYHERK
ncbi:phosphatase PAP2 family protein [Patescibacteria group bacterium]